MKKFALFIALLICGSLNAAEIEPVVLKQVLEEAKKNENWKNARLTGTQEQVVFMNVSPKTNPKNEIGMEVHTFDQTILIVEGEGKAVLNETTSSVKAGDLIFIPMGTQHNVINVDRKKELKLISFYSMTDIPAETVYKTKAEEAEE